MTENAEEIQKLTQTGEVFGTPLYMSPEQCRGEKLEESSDIYSLGCVLYEALTGSPPFKGESSIATIMMHMDKDAPAPSKLLKLPQPLISVLHRCLEKKRQRSLPVYGRALQRLAMHQKWWHYSKNLYQEAPLLKRKKFVADLAVLSFVAMLLFVSSQVSNRKDTNNADYHTIRACNDRIAREIQMTPKPIFHVDEY